MRAHRRLFDRINVTQRQAALAVLALYFVGTVLLVLIQIIVRPVDSNLNLWGGLAGSTLFGVAWLLYYKRNWEPARYLAAIVMSLLIGSLLPEPFVSQYAPMVIVIPIVLALLLTDPIWVIINSLLTLVLLLIRADGSGVYAHPVTLILYAMIVGCVLISRLIAETSVRHLKQAQEKIERQLQKLHGLRTIDTAIINTSDIHKSLDAVLSETRSELGVDAAAILLIDTESQMLEYAAGIGFHSPSIEQLRLQITEGLAGRAIAEGRTLHIPDLEQAGAEFVAATLLRDERFVSFYAVPLVAKGELEGVMEIFHRSKFSLDPEGLDFLETLAGQAALAIDNARLFEDLQRSNVELERRVAERTAELQKTNVELELASRAKDEFLANMSHELRTPLNSILGLSESLLEERRGPLNEDQQVSLNIIENSGRHLLELINDILDLSKIEAGKLDFYPQLIGVDDLCRSSLMFIKAQAAKKSIQVTYHAESSVSKIVADPKRLKQILVNLLSNAIKFTPEKGNVELRVSTDSEQELIHFSVIDSGIGVALDDLHKLFQPFTQVDSSLNRQYDGTGLGLALVQKLTDLHGGSVSVESEVGRGSRFTVNLPWDETTITQQPATQTDNASTQEPAESSQGESNHHATVLLAEDNMANFLTISDYLRSYGYEVILAHDGLEAIRKAEEFDPDIILMDIQMPVRNGLEAISHLRADHRFESTPIIALTALTMPGDRERCILAGASDYMTKPVRLKTLEKNIEKLLKLREHTL